MKVFRGSFSRLDNFTTFRTGGFVSPASLRSAMATNSLQEVLVPLQPERLSAPSSNVCSSETTNSLSSAATTSLLATVAPETSGRLEERHPKYKPTSALRLFKRMLRVTSPELALRALATISPFAGRGL